MSFHAYGDAEHSPGVRPWRLRRAGARGRGGGPHTSRGHSAGEQGLGRQYLQTAYKLGGGEDLEPRYQVWAAWSILQAGAVVRVSGTA